MASGVHKEQPTTLGETSQVHPDRQEQGVAGVSFQRGREREIPAAEFKKCVLAFLVIRLCLSMEMEIHLAAAPNGFLRDSLLPSSRSSHSVSISLLPCWRRATPLAVIRHQSAQMYVQNLQSTCAQDYDLAEGRVVNVGQILSNYIWVSVQGAVSEQVTSFLPTPLPSS